MPVALLLQPVVDLAHLAVAPMRTCGLPLYSRRASEAIQYSSQ